MKDMSNWLRENSFQVKDEYYTPSELCIMD